MKTYVFLSFITVTTMGCANKSLGLALTYTYAHANGEMRCVFRFFARVDFQFEANESLYELSDTSNIQMLQSHSSNDWWNAYTEKSLQPIRFSCGDVNDNRPDIFYPWRL